MRITVGDVRALHFDDGTPVTAASAIAPLGDGWLVAQDDSTSGAWLRAGGIAPVRFLPPVDGEVHLLAVVDDDDPARPSTALELHAQLG